MSKIITKTRLSVLLLLYITLVPFHASADTEITTAEIKTAGIKTTETSQKVIRSHAIAMHGTPKYAKNFQFFDYVNPEAPIQGQLKESAIGSFDSFNPFIPKGSQAAGIGHIYDSLMAQSHDEPFSLYGLIAEEIEYPKNRSWVIFHLNPKATFHDGHPITSEDVIFTFNALIEKGSPHYQYMYADVDTVEALDERRVKFSLKTDKNKELILVLAQLIILPKHFWQDKVFDEVSLDKPLGSGPYRVGEIKPNKNITYERVADYWAKDLPVNRGRDNFTEVVYEYFGDRDIAFEALRGGHFNFIKENNSKRWATQHQGAAFDSGELIKETIPHLEPQGIQGFAFNLRKPLFHDIILREAMGYAFDFEWSNENLFYGQYIRSNSYFENSELAAKSAISAEERALLEPFKEQLPEQVFTEIYQAPISEGTGKPRANLLKAQNMLKDAGYTLKNDQLYTPDGKAVEFEFLLYSPAFIRILLPFSKNLKTLGITMNIQRVDVTQYIQRLREFDFDMLTIVLSQSSSPGNEQYNYWNSEAADQPSSRNFMGIKNPAIDTLVDYIIAAETREELVTATRALDRVLLWNHYLIPQLYINAHRLTYSKNLHYKSIPPYGIDLMAWWYENDEDNAQ